MNEYSGLRVLCTGGCGFVGSRLVKRLLEQGAIVTVIDDLFTGDKSIAEKYRDYHNGIEFHEGDIDNFHPLADVIGRIDIIFHLAARNIVASTAHPRSDYRSNIGGTLNVLMQSRESPVSKIVYTSSASVYGNPKYLPINEDDQINLLTPYAVSKYAGEGYCMAFNESYGLPVAVLRLSNVYGPHQSPSNPYCGVVAKFMDKAKKGEPIEIHGNGQATRDFTYVDDVVDALLLAGMSSKAEGEVFNVATGIETDITELANSIAIMYEMDEWKKDKDTDFEVEIKYIDRRDIDNIHRRVLNIEKIRRKLGWTPKTTLEHGLQLTKEWLDEQKSD